jgi:AcrR family transcriptional regulator
MAEVPRRPGRPSRGEGELARDLIVAAAVQLFSEQGFAGTSVSQICERAGVGKPALYWHFGNKEGLFDTVLEAVSAEWIEELRKTSSEGDPAQRLQNLTAQWKRAILERSHQLRLPMIAQLEQGKTSESTRIVVLKLWRRAEAALVDGIRRAMPGLDLPQLEYVAFVTVSLLQGVMLRHAVEPDEARLDRMLDEVQRTFSLLIWDRLPPSLRAATVDSMVAPLTVEPPQSG